MIHVVGALDEGGLFGVDAQLDFHYHCVPVQQVHQDVPGFRSQLVLHFHDLQYLWVVQVDPFYFIVECDDLVFLRCAPAPKEISYSETHKLRFIIPRPLPSG